MNEPKKRKFAKRPTRAKPESVKVKGGIIMKRNNETTPFVFLPDDGKIQFLSSIPKNLQLV